MNSIKEKWMDVWSKFEEDHPKLAKWVYQIFYFFVFSMGVTVFSFLLGIVAKKLLGIDI